MKVRNSYTGEFDYRFSPTSAKELADLCTRLREAQPRWEKSGLDARAQVLRRFSAAVAEHREALIESLMQDTGRYGASISEAALEPKIEREIAAAVGAELIKLVDYVCFTGSVATGRKVYRAAADRFIPVSLELGGKDPLVVLEGADPQKAAMSALIGSCVASGQLCTSLERFYVAEPIYEEFVRAAVACARRVEINYPDIRKGFIGPFIPEKQADTVLEHIQDAVNKGAKLHTGGEIVEHGGKWCLPTVLTDVDHSMQVMRDESFGPLLPIMPFSTVDEAIHLANDSDYGLTASVYAGNSQAGEEVARAIQAGGVSVNRAGISLMVRGIEQDARNASGMGKNRMGREGTRRFARSKAIMTYGGQEDEIAPAFDCGGTSTRPRRSFWPC